MYSRVYQRKERNNKKTPHSLSNTDSRMVQGRSFTVQLKTLSHQPDLKTSLTQAERYGHHLDKIQCAISTTPIQMSTDEEEKKLRSGMDLEVNELTNNKKVLDLTNELKTLNHQKDIKNKNINIEPKKHFTEKITRATEFSKSKEKDHKQNPHEHLTLHGKNNVLENKAAEEPSLVQDPEVTRLLNKPNQSNLEGSGGSAQQNNQTKNFITPPSTYNENKTASTKTGSRSHYLANREAMNMLGNNKSFATTQRAVKIPVTNTHKPDSKVEDSKQQVKLKDAAELVRDQVINEDRQVKEHVQGTLNLDPATVAKEGGEQLILQKMQSKS